MDMRLFKSFSIWKSVKFGAFLEIWNVLDNRALRNIQNTEQYDQGFDDGDGVRNVPWAWANPRQMRLGFEILF